MFPGSIFRRRSTSFNCVWVSLTSLFTPDNAFESPVVSPPISIVMPFILSANFSTSRKELFHGTRCAFDWIFFIVVCLFCYKVINHLLLSHRLFIRCFLSFPISSAYLFTPIGCALSWEGCPFWIPSYALRLTAIPSCLHL